MYLVGLLVVRLGKHRLLGHSTALDIILGFTLGSLLSRGINGTATLSSCVVACVFLVLIHWLFSVLAWRFDWFGWLIKGESLPLARDGKLMETNMRRATISHKDLELEVRLNGNIEDYREAKAIYLERNGEITVVKGGREPRVIEVKVEDGVQTVRIQLE
jgi:uncharacterized membrane protein YcaP (DUF421 family)